MDLNELKEYAKSKGYSVSMMDRGPNFKQTSVAGRFEIWLEGHQYQGKASFCETLQEAIDKALPYIDRLMEMIQPGRLND